MTILVKSKTESSDKDYWATSNECFMDAAHLYGRNFCHDICAEKQTSKCGDFYWNKDVDGIDALKMTWPDNYWCNPPFSEKMAFINKAIEMSKSGCQGMMLLPYEPLTAWWQSMMSKGCIIYEPDGRYNFMERDGITMKSGVNFGVAFVVFTPLTISESPRIRFRRGIHKLKHAD